MTETHQHIHIGIDPELGDPSVALIRFKCENHNRRVTNKCPQCEYQKILDEHRKGLISVEEFLEKMKPLYEGAPNLDTRDRAYAEKLGAEFREKFERESIPDECLGVGPGKPSDLEVLESFIDRMEAEGKLPEGFKRWTPEVRGKVIAVLTEEGGSDLEKWSHEAGDFLDRVARHIE